MIGTIVWIKPGDDRPNEQRAKILACAEGYAMLETFAVKDNIILIPYHMICGIEIVEGETIKFKVTGTERSKST